MFIRLVERSNDREGDRGCQETTPGSFEKI